MSIRAKITLFVLIAGLSEATLLGVIAYDSVETLSDNAAEIRKIGAALEGARNLNVALSRPTDPLELLVNHQDQAVERFTSDMEQLEAQVTTCATTACHDYEKRPPRMAQDVLVNLRTIRENGVGILSSIRPGDPPPFKKWAEQVDAPARKVSRTTEEMSATLLAKAKEIENSSRQAEHGAVLLVAFTTLFCIFTAVALCHPIARGITRPLEKLADQTLLIAEGDLEVRAAEGGPREITRLARSFNQMLDNLAQDWERLIALRDRLEATVEARVIDLRRKDDELKRSGRLASVGLIAGAVAHNLNNPLTSVILNAETLLDSIPEDDARHQVIMDIMRDLRRCRQISDEIRAMSREARFDRSPCNMAELVEEAIRLVRFKYEPRKILVSTDAQSDLAPSLCAAPQMLQLITNLIDNAVDASADGGHVEVSLRSDPARLVLEVRDHGEGIASAQRESLFTLLYTTKAGGTGLGLAICRRIAEQHEGSIEFETWTVAESAKGHGSLFRLTLPVAHSGKEESSEQGSGGSDR